MGDIFGKSSRKSYKKAIVCSILLSAVLYWIFIFTVIGVSGDGVSPDALAGMAASRVGALVLKIAALMGFFAVFTSFLALAADLKAIYFLDFKISRLFSWLLVSLPIIILFVLGFNDFTKILGMVGTLAFGFMGFFIVLMARKRRGRTGFSEIMAGLAILLAVGYEMWGFLF